MKSKATEGEIEPVIQQIHNQATTMALPEPLLASTDAYVTSICYIGSKSLSHVLSCIERCKQRLLDIGATSESARRQIITSVMAYWVDQPGIGVNIVDKLLNYTILTPISVIEWALVEDNKGGDKLAASHIFEMVASTVQKVTNRVRGLIDSKNVQIDDEQRKTLEGTLLRERQSMTDMFVVMEDALTSWASGAKDQAMEAGLGDSADEGQIREWGQRWLRVFRRKMAVEEAFMLEAGNRVPVEEQNGDAKPDSMDVEA